MYVIDEKIKVNEDHINIDRKTSEGFSNVPVTSISGIRYGFRNRYMLRTKKGFLFFPTVGSLIFDSVFLGLGIYVAYKFSPLPKDISSIFLYPIQTFQHYIRFLPRMINSEMLWGHLFGLLFLGLGIWMLYLSFLPICFNSKEKYFIRGFFLRKKFSYDDMAGIQLISDCGNDAESSIVYEMNIILMNNSRVYVYCETNKNIIRKNALELSKELSVAVSDKI